MRRPFAILMMLMLLLLMGCSSKEQPVASPPGPAAPVVAAPAEDGAAPGLTAPPEPAHAGDLQRVQYKPGQPLDRVGLFIMNVATGEVEGWVVGPDQIAFPGAISDDNRWVNAELNQWQYVADRTTGKVYRNQGRLVAARGDVLLFQEGTQFALTHDAMGSFQPVALKPPATEPATAAIAPDGKAAVLVSDRHIYLIEPESGKYREVGQLQPPMGDGNVWVTLSAGADGFTVLARFSPGATRLSQFTWDGRLTGERSVDHDAFFSPDGKLVAWHDSIMGLTDTITLASAVDKQPKLRVIGEATGGLPFQGPYWLPDSSGLLLRTSRGPRLLKLDGTLTVPASPKNDDGMGLPVPAPDRAGIYAVAGTTVIDGAGKVLAAAVPASEGKWMGVGGLAPWGDRSDELRFVTHTSGKGISWDPMTWAPTVEFAPFPEYTGLTVRVGAGDCVNLREDFDKAAPAVACLPDGTRLTKAKPPGRLGKDGLYWDMNPEGGGMSLDYWYYVQTDAGQRGWVFLSGDYLAFAAARLGEPAPDSAGARLTDDLVTMRYWLSVTTGDTQCGPSCPGAGFLPMQAFGSLMDWCKQEIPSLPATPDAAAFVKTCEAMQALAPDVGRTDRDEVFKAKARELLSGLPH